jgi:heterodisulfide reductase subunit C/nitrate reductase gamma subunit
MSHAQIASLSLILCLAGLLYRMARWFTVSTGPEARAFTPGKRLAGALRAMGTSLVQPRHLLMLLRVALLDVFLQRSLLGQSRLRWAIHMSLSYGTLILLLLHVFDDQISTMLFKNYVSTLDPFQGGRHLLGGLVLLAVLFALIRRRTDRTLRPTGHRANGWLLGLLALIVISGACLEAAKILSPTLFDEMVRDYMGSEDPDEIEPLKTFWAAEFHVGFDPIPDTADPGVMEAGRRLHGDFCADCHSPPDSAALAYPLVVAFKPLAAALDRTRVDLWLGHAHFLISCLALILLPWTGLFHLVSTPLNLLAASGGPTATNQSVNRPARRALGLDACTRCGICSAHCAVAPIERALGNTWILPSEKLTAVARNAVGRLDASGQTRLSEGSFICTACGRCTARCPACIDLRDLWLASSDDLIRQGHPPLHDWIREHPAAQWARSVQNQGTQENGVTSLRRTAGRLSDNADTFWACVQCTTCTNVCPVVDLSEDPRRDLDLTPQQVMNLMRLRLKPLALGSRMVWDCVSCYKCQEHCPQGVRVADVLYELRNEARLRLKNPAVETAPADAKGKAA